MKQNSQPPTTTASPEERASEFRPDQGGTETASAGTLLVVAYLVMWALLLGFVLLSWRRQGKVDARLGELERSLGGEKPPADP
jgi:CcmD family protein